MNRNFITIYITNKGYVIRYRCVKFIEKSWRDMVMDFINRKRGSFFIKSALVFALIVATCQINFPTASAKETKSENLSTFEDYLSRSKKVEDVELHQTLLEEVKEALVSDESLISVSQDKIDLENTKLMSSESEDQTYHSIVVPLSTVGNHELSNVTFLFSEEGELLTVNELHVIKNTEGNTTVSMYVNGKNTLSIDTQETFMTVAEVHSQGITSRNVIGSLAECLGVTTGVATAIVTGCGIFCGITLGTGCLACIAAAAGVGVGGLIGCRL